MLRQTSDVCWRRSALDRGHRVSQSGGWYPLLERACAIGRWNAGRGVVGKRRWGEHSRHRIDAVHIQHRRRSDALHLHRLLLLRVRLLLPLLLPRRLSRLDLRLVVHHIGSRQREVGTRRSRVLSDAERRREVVGHRHACERPFHRLHGLQLLCSVETIRTHSRVDVWRCRSELSGIAVHRKRVISSDWNCSMLVLRFGPVGRDRDGDG